MTLKQRLSADLATARRRFSALRHMATFLTLELVSACVALVWGAVVAIPGGTFTARLYDFFDPFNEGLWGAYFAGLGVVGVYVALTRPRRTRFVMNVVTCFSFAQLTWRLWHGDAVLPPSPAVYTLIGMVLPLVCGVWHLACLVIDDIEAAPPEVRRAWLDD